MALVTTVYLTWMASLPCDPTRDDRQAATVHLAEGLRLRTAGDLPAAEIRFSRAIALDPGLLDAYAARGQTRRALLDLHGAVRDARQLTRLRPTSPGAQRTLARAERDLEAFYRALDTYAEQRTLTPWNTPPPIESLWRAQLGRTAVKPKRKPTPVHSQRRRDRGEARSEVQDLGN